MLEYTIEGIAGIWRMEQQMGVFCKLLLAKDGLSCRVPFKEWEELKGKVKDTHIVYSYGEIHCPVSRLIPVHR